MRRTTRRMTLATVGLIAVSATALGGASMAALSQSGQSVASSRVAGEPGATQSTAAPRPTRLAVPTIGVDDALVDLGAGAGNTMQLPPYGSPGWFTGSVAPGATGAAVITGYIGNSDKPGPFVKLADLRMGAAISVTRADGSIADFTVTDIKAYDPGSLPLKEIYSARRPVVRIVTTGGSLRPGEPNRNVVVTGEMTGIR